MDIRPTNEPSPIQNKGVRSRISPEEIEEPGLRSFFEDWLSKRGDAKFPHPDTIDLLDYTEEATRWSILDVINGGESFYIRMCGTETVAIVGMDLTGQHLSSDLSELPGEAFQNRIASMLKTVIATSAPIVFGPMHSSLEGREYMTLYSICLPFSKDGEMISSIIHAIAVVPGK